MMKSAFAGRIDIGKPTEKACNEPAIYLLKVDGDPQLWLCGYHRDESEAEDDNGIEMTDVGGAI